MRYLFGFLCVCALGAVPLLGCGETSSDRCQGVTCDDDKVCTEDACNPANGTCDFTPVGDGTACADGACLRGDCTTLITVSGIVNVIDRSPPPVNATVSVLGTSLSTTTNERGDYSFGAFAGDWVLQASQEGTWGEVAPVTVPSPGPFDIHFAVFTDATIAELSDMLPIDIDDTKGWVSLNFEAASGEGGETATLSEPYLGAWTWDAEDNIVLSDALLPGSANGLDFMNVELTEELTVTPKGVDGVNSCELTNPDSVYLVMAKFFVGVDVSCTPVP